jgi:hypothetical protein
MDFQWIQRLWNDHADFAWWQMLLIGLFFLVLNFGIFIAMWYVRRGVAIKCGYPKRNKKQIKKRMKLYTVVDSILLIRITREAEHKGILLYINLGCHLINMISYVACFVGFVGCMITLADGWALTMLTFSEIGALFVTVLIEFVPDLIWLPSERRRYNIRK